MVELEGKPGVPTAFGGSGALGYDESQLSGTGTTVAGDGTVRARRITPDDALLEYLADHGMKRISKRLVSSGALDVVATAIPGIRDILVLGKVKSLERQGIADLILVDAPATGHAMTFLSSAQGLLDAARSGPVRTQAADVVELLSDPERCQVALVTLPEEMPVNEVVEAAYALEDRIGISLGPVIVNACLPRRSRARARPRARPPPRPASPWPTTRSGRCAPRPPSGPTASGCKRSSGPAWPPSCPFRSCWPPSSSAPASGPASSTVWPTTLADGVRRLPDSSAPPDSTVRRRRPRPRSGRGRRRLAGTPGTTDRTVTVRLRRSPAPVGAMVGLSSS